MATFENMVESINILFCYKVWKTYDKKLEREQNNRINFLKLIQKDPNTQTIMEQDITNYPLVIEGENINFSGAKIMLNKQNITFLENTIHILDTMVDIKKYTFRFDEI